MTKNSELILKKEINIARGVLNQHPIFIDRASGSEIWDIENKRYIDFASGVSTLNTGHLHPKILSSVLKQLTKFSHTSFQSTPYEIYITLAEKINKLVPIRGPRKSFFVTTGAEAVENAVKVARAATSKSGIICFDGCYHGRTLLTMAMTGKTSLIKEYFAPFPPEIYHIPFPSSFHNISVSETLKALERLFNSDIPPNRVAAIIIEPIQGEGGFLPAPKELMQALRSLCDHHNILFIVDEIQTGFGRTGKMFATELYDIEADIICLSKSLAGGFPLACVSGNAEIMDKAPPGAYGGTYSGNPISCAAALAVLEIFEEEKLLERALKIGKKVFNRFMNMKNNNQIPLHNLRATGAMIGFDLYNQESKPDSALAKNFVDLARAEGVILLPCGVDKSSIRLMMPLNIPYALLEEGLDKIEQAFLKLSAL